MGNNVLRKVYFVKGTHCRSCEIVIEDKISQIQNVRKVKANHRRGTVEVLYQGQNMPDSEVESAIHGAGYSLGKNEKRPFLSRNSMDYIELGFAAGLILVLYIWISVARGLGLDFSFSSTPGLMIVGLIGLTAGISTCMALIGGIVLAMSARHSELHPEATASQKFRPHLFFNLGRIISFVILGGLIGWIGSSFRFSNVMLGALIIGTGLVMFILGIKLIEIFPRLSGGFTLPKGISRWFGIAHENKEYSHRGAFVTGALTFFLPCGFTQAMQIYAVSTGSFSRGAMIMGIFALGTMPGLLGIGGLTSVIKGWFARYFFKFAGLVVIILAIFNMANGLRLSGVSLAWENNATSKLPASARIENGIQILDMEQAVGYKPNKLTVKRGIPVRWVIHSTNSYNCSSYLVVPALEVTKQLYEGENIIEFTPTQPGPIRFTCGMGMYAGVINVVN